MADTIFRIDGEQQDSRKKSPDLRRMSGSRGKTAAAGGKKRRKASVRQRRKYLAAALALIILVFSGFIALLYNQSRVIEVTAENAALQREINALKKDNAQRREEISKNLDLATIRREAERLGLQMPVEAQIIEVRQSERDEIVTNLKQANAEGVDADENDMAQIFANVEGFFKTIH